MREPRATTAYTQSEAESYDSSRFSDSSGQTIHRTELAMVRAAIEQLPTPSRVLEVGCGTGRLLVEVALLGHEVDGVDASPAMLDELRQKLPAAQVSVASATSLACDSDSYDFAYAVRLLNQTESRAYALEVITEMIRVVRPDGFVLVEFVNRRRPSPSRRKTVALTAREVREQARTAGADVVWERGAFALGMTAHHLAPGRLVEPVSALDNRIARFFPSVCSRGYVLLHKHS